MNTKIPSFDTLLQMAKQEPEKLETLRLQLAKRSIEAAPKKDQQRLQGLQFQIDCTLRSSKNPIAVCIKLSLMMHKSLEEMVYTINHSRTIAVRPAQRDKAKILSFPNSH